MATPRYCGPGCDRPGVSRFIRSRSTDCQHEVGTDQTSKKHCHSLPHNQTNPRVARPSRPGRPRRTTHPRRATPMFADEIPVEDTSTLTSLLPTVGWGLLGVLALVVAWKL